MKILNIVHNNIRGILYGLLFFVFCMPQGFAQDNQKSNSKEDSMVVKAPHGGQLKLDGLYYLEMVSKDNKIAFYVYDTEIMPVNNKQFKASLQLQFTNKTALVLPLIQEGQNGFSPLKKGLNSFNTCKVVLTLDGKSMAYNFQNRIQSPLQYTCPAHPEVVKNEPGQCPKCGMDLVEKKEMAKSTGN